MQSDPRVQQALSALLAERIRFRGAIESARGQMRAYLATHGAGADERTTSVTAGLGAFASGRIDTDRFASVFSATGLLGYEMAERIERCIQVLDELLVRGDGLFTAKVPHGGNLRSTVDSAFGETGRAFGAVLAFQAAKTGSYRAEHDRLLRSFSFRRWNRSERHIAPPLVVEVDGEDFAGEQLAGFIDGRVRIIAVVRSPSSPAPLARIITPGVLVLQSVEAEALSVLAGFDGPGVAALVPAGAAIFVHDPRAGSTLRDRLRIDVIPDAPTRSVGARSVWQQREELAQLGALATIAAEETAQVDTLASWLLRAGGFGAAQPGATPG
ncbi:MAG: hypothetical protein ACSLFK_06165 [Gemmatimonadaceae bacterium]